MNAAKVEDPVGPLQPQFLCRRLIIVADRCPKCGSTALHQQLNKEMFNCAVCGAWFKLTKLESDFL